MVLCLFFFSCYLLVQKLVDARIELHPALRAPRTRAKDLLFLDIALESSFKTAIEKRLLSLNFNNPPVYFFSSV